MQVQNSWGEQNQNWSLIKSTKLNEIGWICFAQYCLLLCYQVYDTVQDCKLLLLSFEFCQILLKWLNIFIQNGWKVWLKKEKGPFGAKIASQLHCIHYCSCKMLKISVAFHSNIKRYSSINTIFESDLDLMLIWEPNVLLKSHSSVTYFQWLKGIVADAFRVKTAAPLSFLSLSKSS